VPLTVANGAPLCVEVLTTNGRTATGASAAGVVLPAEKATTVGVVGYTYRHDAHMQRIAFTWSGTSAGDLDFASVPTSTFGSDGERDGRPGLPVIYPHRFTAGTAGSVRFSITASTSSPEADDWSQQVYADTGCLGELPPDAALLYPPAVARPLTAGQPLCVVLRKFVPAEAALGSRHATTLQAEFTFDNASPALSATYSVQDFTTVSNKSLTLVKEVRNLTQGVTAFGASNQARPGDTLEYRIRYRNTSLAALDEFTIDVDTPGFTTYVSALTETTPASLTACHKTTPANATAVDCAVVEQVVGNKGAVKWRFTGALAAGESGAVLFRVKVD
jgi:hypothetical protein